ncbi:MAG TPA: hypothetical protein VHG08_04825 [Longimicrobium sp.]|nr:hypothetical protein [Longimicrobium sp.]
MRKLRMDLDQLRVESFVTDDAGGANGGTVFGHESEGCRQIPPGLIRKTHDNSCFVASCNGNGSCFDCSIQISCWGCNTPLCPPGHPIDKTFDRECETV